MNDTLITFLRPTVIAPDQAIDLTFVPPLQRRRLSLLQQRYFSLAHHITQDLTQDYRVTFASQVGEDRLTRQLVEAFNGEHDVSPMRFSTSVYNAAPGLYSIFTKNKASYNAIAGGEETLDCGLLDALLSAKPCLWIAAEEMPDTPTLGAFILDGAHHSSDHHFICKWSKGNPDAPLLTHQQLSAFLNGELTTLSARYFTLSRI